MSSQLTRTVAKKQFGRKRKVDDCPNRLFLSYLQEWATDAVESESKACYTYNKACKSMKKYPLPLQSGAEAVILENIGKKICTMLDARLAKDASKEGISARAFLEKSRHVPPSWWDGLDENNKQKENTLSSKQKKTKGASSTSTKKKQKYVPQKNSGAYAILIALYQDYTSPSSVGYLNKDDLMRNAQPFANKSFSIPEKGTYYTAWSSMATLMDKDLVRKYSHPPKFELTDKGIELAARMENSRKLETGSTTPTVNVHRNYSAPPAVDVEQCGVLSSSPSSSFPLSVSSGNSFSPIRSSVSASVPTNQKAVVDIDLTLSSDDEPTMDSSPVVIANSKPRTSSQTESTSPHARSNDNDSQFLLYPGDYEIVLCVDTRETAGDKRKKVMKHAVFNSGVDYVERCLQVADFVWIAREKHCAYGRIGKEVVLDYIVERKCVGDLCQSIRDGRYQEQKIRLKQTGLKNIIYLIEDIAQMKHQSLPEKTLRQALYNTQVVDHIFVKCTKSIADTASYLKDMTDTMRNLYRGKTLRALRPSTSGSSSASDTNHDNSVNCDLPTFTDFNDESMKHRGLTMCQMFLRMLMQIHGLSYERAESIIAIYPTACHLMDKYDSLGTEKEKEELLSKLKCGPLKRNLGISLSRSVYRVFN